MNLPDDVELLITEDLPTIETNRVLLAQVFRNLIDNAIKFNNS